MESLLEAVPVFDLFSKRDEFILRLLPKSSPTLPTK